MKTFYHGTTMECARSILKKGFNSETDTVWSCSDCDKLYVRDLNSNNWNDEDECIYFTIESGQIAAAYLNSLETSIAVFKFMVDDDVAEQFFEEDYSCENMDGCYQIEKVDLDKLIEQGAITCELYEAKDAYIPYLRPFYLRFIADSPYMYIEDQLLRYTIEKIQNVELYMEDLSNYSGLEFVSQIEGKPIDNLVAFAA